MKMMKKWKRIFAGLLTLALLMQALPMQVLADIGGGNSVNTPVTKTGETIDTNQKGSLTLYKYVYQNTAIPSTNPGTGEEGQTIPGDPAAIAGVGFTLYKISDLDDYYSGVATGNETLPTTPPADLTDKNVGSELLTDAQGQVSWKNLDLGIYYVVETTPPTNVNSTPVAFYVSIPMTTTDGENWLYDVVVYPKNQTTNAGVTLQKYGITGGLASALEGAKFVLQKYDSGTTTWYYVKNTQPVESDPPIWTYSTTDKSQATKFATNASGQITFSGLSAGVYQFTEIYAPKGYIMNETVTYPFEIAPDGKVYEYDTTTSTHGGEITSKTITVNNEKPDIDKQVQNAAGGWGDDADYSIGDTVPFKVIVDIPSNVDKLKTFKVTDTMSTGLTSPTGFLVSGYTTVAMTDPAADITTNFTVDTAEAGKWKIDFSDKTDIIKDYKKVVITFNATVDTDAEIAGNGNPNDVKLEYSNQILTDPGATPPTSTVTDKVVVYTFQIKLTKEFEGADTGTYAAKFQLYKRNDASGATTLTVGGVDIMADAVGSEVTVTKDTPYNFKGLENGEYYLVETETADGYNLLKQPVKVALQVYYDTTITTTPTEDPDTGAITESSTATTKYYSDPGKTSVMADTDISETITNKKGFTLPTTGGIGTFVFVFAGIALMATAVILFITSKKKEKVQ